jgi:hypothetical protein
MLLVLLHFGVATADAQLPDRIPQRPLTITADDAPAEQYEPPTLPQRFARAAPAVALEAPAQQRERFPVQRAAFESTEVSTDSTASSRLDVLQVYRQSQESASMNSAAMRPMTLLQAIGKSTDRAAQLSIVRQYWNVAITESACRWSSANLQLVQSLQQPQDRRDQHALAAAVASAMARNAELEIASLNARQELLDIAKLGGDMAFHASDEPIVGEYQANLEAIFAQRAAPPRIVHLARLLPIQQQLVTHRARAVQAAESALRETLQRYESGQTDLQVVQEDLRRLDAERTAFLSGIREYNGSIAEYSLSVVGKSHSNATLVSTLVRRPSATQAAPSDSRSSQTRNGIRTRASGQTDRPDSTNREPARLRSVPTSPQAPNRISTATRANSQPSAKSRQDDPRTRATHSMNDTEDGTPGTDTEPHRINDGALRRSPSASDHDEEVQPASASLLNARRSAASSEANEAFDAESNQEAAADRAHDATDAMDRDDSAGEAGRAGDAEAAEESGRQLPSEPETDRSNPLPRRSRFHVPFQLDTRDLKSEAEDAVRTDEVDSPGQRPRATREPPAAGNNPSASEPIFRRAPSRNPSAPAADTPRNSRFSSRDN